MLGLCVNIDHIATIRQARRGEEPDPVQAALLVELAGASGVTVHLREDRRHIHDRDVELLRRLVKTTLNLEMAATEEMLEIALAFRPEMATLVPERREELTTEGGLDVHGHADEVGRVVRRLREGGILVSLFIDPEDHQVSAAARAGADFIELHTGSYAEAKDCKAQQAELTRLIQSAMTAKGLGLRINAGHGLDYRNVGSIAAIPEVEELSIGHSIIARAVLVGLERAIREMLSAMKAGYGHRDRNRPGPGRSI